MPDRETVITQLKLIHAWAEFARDRDEQFFTAKHLEDTAQWADDAVELLKEQEAVVRCKDCKHGSFYCTEDVCGETLIECNRPDLGDAIEIHGWKWFCADGERRDDDA